MVLLVLALFVFVLFSFLEGGHGKDLLFGSAVGRFPQSTCAEIGDQLLQVVEKVVGGDGSVIGNFVFPVEHLGGPFLGGTDLFVDVKLEIEDFLIADSCCSGAATTGCQVEPLNGSPDVVQSYLQALG
jgi:hypothetical protein